MQAAQAHREERSGSERKKVELDSEISTNGFGFVSVRAHNQGTAQQNKQKTKGDENTKQSEEVEQPTDGVSKYFLRVFVFLGNASKRSGLRTMATIELNGIR